MTLNLEDMLMSTYRKTNYSAYNKMDVKNLAIVMTPSMPLDKGILQKSHKTT